MKFLDQNWVKFFLQNTENTDIYIASICRFSTDLWYGTIMKGTKIYIMSDCQAAFKGHSNACWCLNVLIPFKSHRNMIRGAFQAIDQNVF